MLANILFKPIGIIFGVVLAKKVANTAFDSAYERRYGTQAPTALTESAGVTHATTAAAARAAATAATAVVFTRVAAAGFRHVTGFWPGEQRPKPAARLEASSD